MLQIKEGFTLQFFETAGWALSSIRYCIFLILEHLFYYLSRKWSAVNIDLIPYTFVLSCDTTQFAQI